ncbi:DUF72 domain-containing protein [Mucilaginibacter flavus]|uniref:DUF72 domain-containing protein n=1 Tax=Mucilaginibacter flavus TaxID=931504 RepID=UPI0025B3EEBD|nr:DUF72 domain-containing protein [Mucilaginibacter flavus]MDN3583935.1 DUF72 domain-containing protein [Mucilaginibacter flavus]
MDDNTSFFWGTSGLLIPIPKRDFAPQYQHLSRLGYYATLFNSIEINSSFYKLPIGKTVKKWADEVPDGFRFTFKLWREITHNKNLSFKPEDLSRFMESIANAGDKKGSLLVQFPASIQVNNLPAFGQLINTIRANDAGKEWDVAVEFRHRSWYQDNVFDLLQQYDISMVIHDMPASATPLSAVAGDVVYLRFHGPGGGYRGSYADDFLYEYAQYIKEWQSEGKNVYTYFNNTAGDALNNLQVLKKYVIDEV